MAEIKRCFQTSPVSLPVFIYLGFDRYGWIPVPTELDVEIFEKIQSESSEEDREILKKTYQKDSNAVPVLYRLKQVENGSEWREAEEKLRSIFEKFEGISEKLVSMTEQEVKYALGTPHIFLRFLKIAKKNKKILWNLKKSQKIFLDISFINLD